MATLADIQNKIYALTGTDSSSYSNANMLIDINLWRQKIVSMILDSADEVDWDDPANSTYPIWKATLSAARDIQIPASLKMLKIKDISVSYDGTNLYRAEAYDIAEGNLPVADAANTAAQAKIDSNMSRTSPRFDIRWGSVWLYPMPLAADVSRGAYIVAEFFRQPVDFTLSDLTTGTATTGVDASFEYMLAYGPSSEYATAKQLPQLKMIVGSLQDFEARLRQQYSSKQLDRRYDLSSDYQSYK